MGRKTNPENIPVFLSMESFDRLVRDASNVIRWNPTLAIKLMEVAFSKGDNPLQVKEWNRTVRNINKTIESIESQTFYNQKEYWKDKQPTRLNTVTEELSLEDYIAMEQYRK